MSVANRIGEMTNHVQNIYDTIDLNKTDISDLNKNIDNVSKSIKRTYLDMINNGYDKVWDNWEKVTGIGSNITLNNTVKAPMKTDLLGDTEQESTTGKNLLAPISSRTSQKNGIDFTFDEETQTFTFNGTCTTDDTSFPIMQNNIDFISGTTKMIAYLISGSVENYCNLQCFQTSYTNGESLSLVTLSQQNPIVSRTSTHAGTYLFNTSRIRFNNGSVANNFKIKIMITNNEDITYEPYTNGASPNPDYPQEIKNVSGENEIKVIGKNLFNLNDTHYTRFTTNFTVRIGQNSVYVKNSRGDGNGFVWWNIPVTTGKSITISYGDIEEATVYDNNKMQFQFREEAITSYSSDLLAPLLSISKTDKKITVEATNKYLILCLRTANSGEYTINNIQVEYNDTQTSYKSYQEQNYLINLPVKNLFEDLFEDGSISTTTGENGTLQGYKRTNGYTNVLKNKTYTFSISQEESQIVIFYYNETTYLSFDYLGNTSKITFTTPTNCTKIRIRIQATNNISNAQLEEGSQVNLYTPFGTTPIELCKIGDYQDYIKRSTGKNLFDNTIVRKADANYQSVTETTINTGKRLTYIDATTTTTRFLVYAIMDLTNYVGKTIRFKANFTPSASNTGRYIIGLCNKNGGNRIAKQEINTSGAVASFVVPELVGEQTYLLLNLYINGRGTLNQNDYIEFTNMILTIDDEDMTYEPYGHQFYLHKDIGDIVLDGSESGWSMLDSSIPFRFPMPDLKLPNTQDDIPYIKSNYYIVVAWNSTSTSGSYLLSSTSNEKYIRIRNNDITTLNDFKQWLSTHNTKVQYVLQTPTTEVISEENYPILYKQLSDIQDYLTSYDNQTNLLVTADNLPIVLNATALKNIE